MLVRRLRAVVAVLAATAVLGIGPASAATPIPAQVYAPYFETWTADSISGIAQDSGARYFTLAFLETLGKSSCHPPRYSECQSSMVEP